MDSYLGQLRKHPYAQYEEAGWALLILIPVAVFTTQFKASSVFSRLHTDCVVSSCNMYFFPVKYTNMEESNCMRVTTAKMVSICEHAHRVNMLTETEAACKILCYRKILSYLLLGIAVAPPHVLRITSTLHLQTCHANVWPLLFVHLSICRRQ